ncbi:hypothetical protein E3N88_16860 [Mikania micrantha]|uniref:INO80 complex subunit B-like conserved region domain-containing protein n=1 Tax=Mikania micrantha TaxID=192012 RepID=A0A5N6NQS4_9ASTR|nr:hypothetical protein E3N88_16860 [Mikania micrantha]
MDEFEGPRFEGNGNMFKRKRTQTCRRPKPEVPSSLGDSGQTSLSATSPSEDAEKISSDDNAVDANPKRKVYNLNQCVSRTKSEYSSKRSKNILHTDGGLLAANEGGTENKLKKVKLKLGGVTRTIQPKFCFETLKNSGSLDAQQPKLTLQDNSDEDDSLSLDKKLGLQGIPWKDFSRVGFTLGREINSMGNNSGGTQGEKSDRARKSKRVPKKRVLDDDFVEDDDDDEIRFLEKLKTGKVAAASGDYNDDSSKKHKSLSRVFEDDPSPSRSGKDSVSVDTDFEEEILVSDLENEVNKGKKPRKDSPDSPNVAQRETTLTSRQRVLLSGRDSSSSATQIEFPNGLPPAAPRKKKEKLTEFEQQLKKAEAAERRRIQNEKAARESEAEAIRKILGQDSSRKKREDKLKKRQEELAQEKAANAKLLAPNTIRTVIGPTGTTVVFAEDIGLPCVFDPKTSCYPPSREKCAGPSCINVYKYRDSKSKLPLCSLQCYKAVHASLKPAASV